MISSETWEDPTAVRERRPTALRSHLFVVLLADHPTASGARHALDGVDTVILGRAESLQSARPVVDGVDELHIGVPARAMSACHARLHRRDGAWVLEDAGSKNGTLVNGIRVERAVLRDGDVIELGRAFFVLRSALDTPDDAPRDLAVAGLSAMHAGLRTLLPALAARHAILSRLSPSTVPIVLLGPTGAGKEVVARAIHAGSGRKGEFVAVNCGALPASLVEGLLFGHVKGAFSGALRDEKGLVRAAEGGTLLLDEIGDLPISSQTALLRMLQESEIVPLGATRPVKVNVRVLAATHRPIDELAATGHFRLDLLARLKGFTHRLPTLEERREDLGVLISEILPQVAGAFADSVAIDVAVARAFLRYAWPLNIRELSQCLGTASMLATNASITASDLPDGDLARLARVARAVSPEITPPLGSRPVATERATLPRTTPPPPASPEDLKLRETLVEQLRASQGNVSAVARSMGKAPFQIRRWMKRFALEASDFR